MEQKYWFVHSPVSEHAPKVKHSSRKHAEDEAIRLAAANSGATFFVLETVAAFATERPRVVEVELEVPVLPTPGV